MSRRFGSLVMALVVVAGAPGCTEGTVGGPSTSATAPASTTAPLPVETTSPQAPAPLVLDGPLVPFTAPETFQVALGDLDGDGDLDAVAANPQANPGTVWLGDGRGGFADTGQRLTPQGHGVGLADFDGDGDLDAFVTCHGIGTGPGRPSRLYLNDGSGTMTAADVDFGDAAASGVEVQVIDLQGDGWPDVYVAYYDPGGRPDLVYVNDGTGALGDSGLRIDEDEVAWGDLDGDGDVDLFGKRYGEGLVVRVNDGAGGFAERWVLPDPGAAGGSIALADLDGDGDLDALVGNGRGASAQPAALLWNTGTGRFEPSGSELRSASLARFGVADLDGDGDLDVVVANSDRPDEVWLGDGAGGFVDSGVRLDQVHPLGLSTTVAFGDVDGDGDLDVVIGSLAAPARLFLNLTG